MDLICSLMSSNFVFVTIIITMVVQSQGKLMIILNQIPLTGAANVILSIIILSIITILVDISHTF